MSTEERLGSLGVTNPDGRFLAILRVSEETPTPLVVVQNWAETLKGR